jgi:hypothetical protein
VATRSEDQGVGSRKKYGATLVAEIEKPFWILSSYRHFRSGRLGPHELTRACRVG